MAALSVAQVVVSSHAAPIEWLPVGDAGNAADTTGYGAVAYRYSIMKYEWTTARYAQFMNAVDPDGTNQLGLYQSSVISAHLNQTGVSLSPGNAAGSKWVVSANWADKPINYVTWFAAARVANWLHNGAQSYSSSALGAAGIDGGAYTLNGATSGTAPAKNADARYWIPLENEWYKAAYYKGGGLAAGYFVYGTQSDSAPVSVAATSVGVGTSGGVSPVVTGNYANYNFGAGWNGQNFGNVTSVGTNGGPSAYGLFDMTGNISEWNDLDGVASTNRGVRGGDWWGNDLITSASLGSTAASNTDAAMGFRLAAADSSSVPEIDPAGMGSVLALVTGGLGLLERRRLKVA